MRSSPGCARRRCDAMASFFTAPFIHQLTTMRNAVKAFPRVILPEPLTVGRCTGSLVIGKGVPPPRTTLSVLRDRTGREASISLDRKGRNTLSWIKWPEDR